MHTSKVFKSISYHISLQEHSLIKSFTNIFQYEYVQETLIVKTDRIFSSSDTTAAVIDGVTSPYPVAASSGGQILEPAEAHPPHEHDDGEK